MHAPLLSPTLATCCPHLLLDMITRIFGKEYRSQSSHYVVFFTPNTRSLLGPSIILRTLFLCTLSLCSSSSLRDQASHPHKTSEITVLYIPIYIFLDTKLEDKKILKQMRSRIPQLQSILNIFKNGILIVWVVPKYLNCSTFPILHICTLWFCPACITELGEINCGPASVWDDTAQNWITEPRVKQSCSTSSCSAIKQEGNTLQRGQQFAVLPPCTALPYLPLSSPSISKVSLNWHPSFWHTKLWSK